MAKFCISGTDKVTGQYYYQRTWFYPLCLCGNDWDYFMEQLSWYHETKFNNLKTSTDGRRTTNR